MNTVGSRVKELRTKRGWSMSELTRRSGIATRHVGAIEQGKTSPTLRTLARIADALETSVEELTGAPFPSDLAPDERELVSRYRALSEHARALLRENAALFGSAMMPRAS